MYVDDKLVIQTSDFSNIHQDTVLITWDTAPDIGQYDLRLEIIIQGGGTQQVDTISTMIK